MMPTLDGVAHQRRAVFVRGGRLRIGEDAGTQIVAVATLHVLAAQFPGLLRHVDRSRLSGSFYAPVQETLSSRAQRVLASPPFPKRGAKGLEQRAIDRIALRVVLGVPLDAQREARGV